MQRQAAMCPHIRSWSVTAAGLQPLDYYEHAAHAYAAADWVHQAADHVGPSGVF